MERKGKKGKGECQRIARRRWTQDGYNRRAFVFVLGRSNEGKRTRRVPPVFSSRHDRVPPFRCVLRHVCSLFRLTLLLRQHSALRHARHGHFSTDIGLPLLGSAVDNPSTKHDLMALDSHMRRGNMVVRTRLCCQAGACAGFRTTDRPTPRGRGPRGPACCGQWSFVVPGKVSRSVFSSVRPRVAPSARSSSTIARIRRSSMFFHSGS